MMLGLYLVYFGFAFVYSNTCLRCMDILAPGQDLSFEGQVLSVVYLLNPISLLTRMCPQYIVSW